MKPCQGYLLALALSAVLGSTIPLVPARAGEASTGWEQVGQASFYNARYVGRRTADGSPYDPAAMTAAHQWLPLGTRLKVTREDGSRAVVVTVTDRQSHAGRVLDLSRGAAEQLGMIGMGTARVRLVALSSQDPSAFVAPQRRGVVRTLQSHGSRHHVAHRMALTAMR